MAIYRYPSLMIRKIFTLLCCFLITFLPVPSIADDVVPSGKVTTVEEGENAPFSGTLFDTQSAARLLTELKFHKKTCESEKERELGLLRSRLTLDLDNLKAEYSALKVQHEKILEIKNEQIEYLQDLSVAPKWYESDGMWFSVGTISGILLTLGAAYAIGQVAK